MPKKILTQKATDNTYYHPDFHIALNYGIDYLHRKFGDDAVREYLMQFTDSYHTPLKRALKKEGLKALKTHYEKIFRIEGADYDINFTEEELTIHLKASPAVKHIVSNGHEISPLFSETVTVVNSELCRDTPYMCEVTGYVPETGACRLHFYMRKP